MARKALYRGKAAEDLASVPLDQFMSLVDSRARRYLKHLPGDYKQLLAKVKKVGTSKPIRTRIREAVIIPQWLGVTFAVHNGKEYKQFTISAEMMGRRLGDFSHTTGRVLHSGPGIGATRGSKFMPLK